MAIIEGTSFDLKNDSSSQSGRSSASGEVVQITTRDNQGPKVVVIRSGEQGQGGTVLKVIRLPRVTK